MTFRELVYMCLDEVKLASDDSYITEDHVLFLIGKYRNFLLRQKYDKTNMPPEDSNFQEIKITIGKGEDVSKEEVLIPFPLSVPRVYTYNNGYTNDIPFVSKHRFRFVGHNSYLNDINYCTINTKHKLQTSKLLNADEDTDVYMWAIFEDCVKAAELSFDGDVLDAECPIESSLISGVQELVVKDILGVAYRPQDTINNGADDLSTIGVTNNNRRRE